MWQTYYCNVQLTSNWSQSSCLGFPSIGMTDVPCHTHKLSGNETTFNIDPHRRKYRFVCTHTCTHTCIESHTRAEDVVHWNNTGLESPSEMLGTWHACLLCVRHQHCNKNSLTRSLHVPLYHTFPQNHIKSHLVTIRGTQRT